MAIQTITALSGLAVGAISVVVFAGPPPPVDLKLVAYNPAIDQITYERTVTGKDTAAVWATAVFAAGGGAEVRECRGSGSADYSKSEASVKLWPMDVFAADGCLEALTPGAKYTIIASVTPFTGRSDSVRSEPFTAQ